MKRLSEEARAHLEEELSRLFEAGDLHGTATRLLEGYGGELLAYQRSVLKSDDAAHEAFGIFGERMWRYLPRFRRASSFRTWAYTLARSAAHRVLADPARRAGRAVPLSNAPEVFALADRLRTETLAHLKTEVKSGVERLKARLSEEDQTLLILRVDRRMSWDEIARIIAGEQAPPEGPELNRRAASLRKRFQRVKERLEREARAEGLLPKQDEAEGSPEPRR